MLVLSMEDGVSVSGVSKVDRKRTDSDRSRGRFVSAWTQHRPDGNVAGLVGDIASVMQAIHRCFAMVMSTSMFRIFMSSLPR